MTLRELTESLYALAQECGLPGLDPDVIQAVPTTHPIHRHVENARAHLEQALAMARAETATGLRLVGKGGATR